MVALSRYVVVSDPVIEKDSATTFRVVHSTRSQRSFRIPAEQWQRVEDGNANLLPEGLKKSLCDAHVLVSPEEDELVGILERNRGAIATTRKLFRCIQPTAACQLGCDYCGQVHWARRLTDEEQDALVESIDRQLATGQYSILTIGWFGGEPLLGLKVMRRLTPLLREVAAKHGCDYQAGITTNGLLLTPDVSEELIGDLGVEDFQVTIDGPADVHDARRCTKKGGATFSQILANITATARDDHARVVVRCNVDRRNADRVSELIDTLAETGLQDRLTVYFAAVMDWSGNGADALALPPDEFAGRELDWMAQLALCGFTPGLIPQAKPIVCMAVTPGWRMTDPLGEVFNCIEVSLIPDYGNPNKYSLGTEQQPRESSEANALSGFNDDIAAHKYDCSKCAVLPICGGMCPKKWNDGIKPCPPWKHNMKERVLLAYTLRNQDLDNVDDYPADALSGDLTKRCAKARAAELRVPKVGTPPGLVVDGPTPFTETELT